MNVTVYSTPTCGYCKMEKEFLTEKNVDFVEVDVSESQEAAAQMVEKTGQMGVPVTIIAREDGSEEVIVGFDQARLTELLSL
jgi:glutaredoxin-like YruB-family protein